MTGKIYVKAPVSSNMMTTTVTVSLVTPLSDQLGTLRRAHGPLFIQSKTGKLTSSRPQHPRTHMSPA